MKIFKTFGLLAVLSSISSFNSPKNHLVTECDIVEFYTAIEPESGVKILNSSGDLEEAELILMPAKLDVGTYEVELTRKGSNIYKVQGTEYYIETRFCYEYASYEDAILKVESQYGYTKGKIYFE
jgi:hypothetical protein